MCVLFFLSANQRRVLYWNKNSFIGSWYCWFCTDHWLLPQWRSESIYKLDLCIKMSKKKKRIWPWLHMLLRCVLTVTLNIGDVTIKPRHIWFCCLLLRLQGESQRAREQVGNPTKQNHWQWTLKTSTPMIPHCLWYFNVWLPQRLLWKNAGLWTNVLMILCPYLGSCNDRVYQYDDDSVIFNASHTWLSVLFRRNISSRESSTYAAHMSASVSCLYISSIKDQTLSLRFAALWLCGKTDSLNKLDPLRRNRLASRALYLRVPLFNLLALDADMSHRLSSCFQATDGSPPDGCIPPLCPPRVTPPTMKV